MGALHRRIGRHVSTKTLLKPYTTCILPVFDYAAVVASPRCNSSKLALERAQRFSFRCILRRFDFQSSVLYERLGLCTLVCRRLRQLLLFYFKVRNGFHYLPTLLCNIRQASQRVGTRQGLRSSVGLDTDLTLPYSRFRSFDCSISYRLAEAWNALRNVNVLVGGIATSVYEVRLCRFKTFLSQYFPNE